jgi:hypothetical protein
MRSLSKILLVYSLTIACIAVPKYDLPKPKIQGSGIHHFLERYTFIIEQDKGLGKAYCKAFIADHNIYTVRHLYFPVAEGQSDVVKLGSSLVKGLEICKEEHCPLDLAYYRSHRGMITMNITGDTGDSYDVLTTDSVKWGDSGSPVICSSHNKVIGIVSSFFPNSPLVPEAGGVIARITKIKPDLDFILHD